MTVSAAQELQLFTELVGSANVRTGTADDAVADAVPGLVVTPGDEAEVASILAAATARGLAVIARGGGTKINWGSPPERCDVVLSTARIEGIVDHEPADLVCVVRAGTTLSLLQERLAAAPGFRQRLMLDPPQGARATIGGVVATAASGPLRTRFGTPRDLVIGASFVLSDGTVGRSGGKVVKNVAGFDVAKLLVGSLGTLAVITEVAFRLHPLPAASRTVVLESRSPSSSAPSPQGSAGSRSHRASSTCTGRRESSWCASTARSGARRFRPSASRTIWAAGSSVRTTHRSWSPQSPTRRGEAPGSWLRSRCCPRGPASFCRRCLQHATPSPCVPCSVRARCDSRSKRWRWFGRRCVRLAAISRSAAATQCLAGDVDDSTALDLMRSVKRQLDPARTLSPGRQVGGI